MAWRPCRSCATRDFPRAAPGGFLRLCRSLRAGARVRFAASRPVRPSSLPALCARPLWRCRWGGGVGAVPASLWRAPGALSAAPGGGGVGGSRWSPGFLGGVPWLCSRCLVLLVSCRSFPWRCVRLAVGSRPGAVPPWGCRSAVPPVRCRGLSRSRGSARSPPLPASRCLGVGVCRCVRVFARCAGFPVVLRCRCRSARACRRAGRGCVPWWLPAPLPRRSPWSLRWPLFPCPRPVAGRFACGGVPWLFPLLLCPAVPLRCRSPGAGSVVPVAPSRSLPRAGRSWSLPRFGALAGLLGCGLCRPRLAFCSWWPRRRRSVPPLGGRRRLRVALAFGFCRWRSVAPSRLRRRAAARLRALVAVAAPPWCGSGGVFLALCSPRGLSPRRVVRLGRRWPGGGFAPPLAGGGALGCAPAVHPVGSAGCWPRRSLRSAVAAGCPASRSAAWWFCSSSLSFHFCYFSSPGVAFLAFLFSNLGSCLAVFNIDIFL